MRAPLGPERSWLPWVILILTMAYSPAALAVTNLRWVQPANSSAVIEFLVYVGPIPNQGHLVYAGLPVPDASGIYSTDVQIDEIDAGIPVYVWVTAANDFGESDPSNANFYPLDCDPLLDWDCDGVPNDGTPGDVPCSTGQVLDCDDNCPYAPNPNQEDTAGIGAGSLPDGIGDDCQCGDVNGDGQVSSVDVAVTMRALMLPPRATMARPDLCDVGSSLDCGTVDAAIIFRALMVPPLATIQQQCEPADNSACPSECTDCQCSVAPPGNLLAHWPFDEGAGTEAADVSGNGHHGTASGTSWTAGQFGSALFFDGSNDYLDVSSISSASPELSVTAWFKAESFGVTDARLISKSTGTQTPDHDFMVSTISYGGEIRLRLRLRTGGTTQTLIGSAAVQAGEWTHVALTYDGATLRLYQNGFVVGSMGMTGAVGDVALDTRIGRNPDGYGPFHGAIDDVRIYDVGLDAAQVLDILAGGT